MRGVVRFVWPLLGALFHAAPGQAAEGEDLPRLNLGKRIAETPARTTGTYIHTFGELSLGKGVRANNPYRLGTVESSGFTATYLNLSLGIAFGPPDFVQHGAQVSLLAATDGIGQEVLGLSYVALLPLGDSAILRGRAGLPIVLNPDSTIGLEAGLGGAWLFTGGIGASAELVGSLFYGAATPDRETTTVPIVALQIGVWFDTEVLP